MLNRLAILSACFWLLQISVVAESRSVLFHKQCQLPIDCSFPAYFERIPEASCVDGFCKCDSNYTVLATSALPYRLLLNRTQYYAGHRATNATVCAPHAGRSCGYAGYSLGYCAPGSYCVIPNNIMFVHSAAGGTCKCNPHRTVSHQTGLCVCDPGYTEDNTGECRYNLPDSCTTDSDCGTEYLKYGLVCSNGTCACKDPNTVWGAGLRVTQNVEVTGIEHALTVEMCLPRAGQTCTELLYCAPRSVCIYNDENPSQRTCRCTPHSIYSNETGLCECEPGYKEHENSLCIREGATPCNATVACPRTFTVEYGTLSSPQKCIHGVCVCDPAIAIQANITKTSMGTVLSILGESFDDELICSLKPKQRCISGYTCSPGSYCKPNAFVGSSGICQCKLDRIISNTTGLCECQPGFEENENGSCIFKVPATCVEDSACGKDTISKSPRVCLNATCICNPANSIYATARTSDIHVTSNSPQFRGFSEHTIAVTENLCAPKPGFPCVTPGLCSPGSYCVYTTTSLYVGVVWSGVGTCRCVPHSRISNETGLCECLPGYTLSSNGTCEGGALFESCSDQNPCGLGPISNLPLTCINATCQCDPAISVYADARTSSTSVHEGNPDFQGYVTLLYPKIPKLCAPKPGHQCVSRGYCSPNSYCVYQNPASWTGKCHCNPNMIISNVTGLCECPPDFDLDNVNNCHRRIPETCINDFDCGTHPISKTSLICINGTCQCDPATSIGLHVNPSFVPTIIRQSYIPQNATNPSAYVHLCVIKPQKSCRTDPVCAPGSICESRYGYYSTDRICACQTDKVISQDTGLCECRQGYIPDERGVCIPGVGARCYSGSMSSNCGLSYGSNQRLKCENSVCVCADYSATIVIQYTPPPNANYKFLGVNSTRNITICASRPGAPCTGYCMPGSFCADQNYNPTSANGTCTCNQGTYLTSRGTCEQIYQAPCDRIRLCSAGLFCIQGKCQCQLKSQVFHEDKLICISTPGGPCHEDDSCTEFSKCQDERCVCNPGYQSSKTNCFIPYGGICNETRECGPSSRYECSANRCDCPSTSHYSHTLQDCLRKQGTNCTSPSDPSECVENALCTSTLSGFRCSCSPGFYPQNNGACLPLLAANNSKTMSAKSPGVKLPPEDAKLSESESPSGLVVFLYVFIPLVALVTIIFAAVYAWKKNERQRIPSLRCPSAETEYDALSEPESNF